MADWDLTFDDIDLIVGRAEKLIAAMEGAEWCRVTNPSGTDVRICIEDRAGAQGGAHQGRRRDDGSGAALGRGRLRGSSRTRPWATIVVDGIMLGVGGSGSLKEPMTWTIEDGRAVKIEGGPEAELLSERHRRFRRDGQRGRRVRHRHEPQGALRLTLREGHDGDDALRSGRQRARLPGWQSHSRYAPRRLGTRRDRRGRRQGSSSRTVLLSSEMQRSGGRGRARRRQAHATSPAAAGSASCSRDRAREPVRACSASRAGRREPTRSSSCTRSTSSATSSSGEGKLSVGEECVPFRAGEAVLIPAGVPHGVVNDSHGAR